MIGLLYTYRSFTFLTIITFLSVSALNFLVHRSRRTLCYLSIFVAPEVINVTGRCHSANYQTIMHSFSFLFLKYICFWRFNSIIMTWNKWLIFTKSVIMGLNNISPWPCPICIVRLPCVITWIYSTPLLFMRAVGILVVVCLSLRKANVTGSRRTLYYIVSVIFYCYHCFVLFALFFTQWLIYPFSFHIDFLT